jgi:hypothetical protein
VDGDTIFGGIGATSYGGLSAGDIHALDLSAYGWANTNIIPDPLNPTNGIIQILNPLTGAVLGTITYQNIEQLLVCFAAGTKILTKSGEVAVEDLAADDLIRTRDHKWQSLRWIGRRDLGLGDMIAGQSAPGPDIQGRAWDRLAARGSDRLAAAPDAVLGWRAEMISGEPEVRVAATHLPGINPMPAQPIIYFHLLFDRHELVLSNGTWSESFQPAERSLSEMDAGPRDELLALLPALQAEDVYYPAARATLKSYEAKLLMIEK